MTSWDIRGLFLLDMRYLISQEIWQERMRAVKEQICQYLMWRKSRPENKISAEVEEKVENAIQVGKYLPNKTQGFSL